MSKCSRCESLPAGWPEVGVLYVAPPLAHTRGTLRCLLWQSGLPFGDPSDDVLAVEVTPESLEHLSELLLDGLSEAELKDCRAVIVEKGSALGLGVLPRMQDLATLTAVVRGEWLLDMLRENRLAVHFQPIVSAAPGRGLRIRVPPARARQGGRPREPGGDVRGGTQHGSTLQPRPGGSHKAIEEAAGLGLEQNIFINFSPTSIYDPTYCLRSAMGAIGRSNLSPERIDFEVTESEQVKDDKHLRTSSISAARAAWGWPSTTSAPATALSTSSRTCALTSSS